MKIKNILAGMMMLASLVCISCEKYDAADTVKEKEKVENGVKVIFSLDKLEQIPFGEGAKITRSNVAADKICTYINLAIFSGTDKVKNESQKIGDSNFGTLAVSLAKGTYKVVVIAHNCNGTATITSPDKITFPDNKVTDTFYYCADITVDDAQTYSLQLKRAVAMFRLVAEDEKPEKVKSMKFYYSGGSSTFNALTGYGCVNSRQTEVRTIDDTMNGKQTQYDVYTFPHEEKGQLKITVTSQDASSGAINERVFDEIPIQRNMITQYSGKFFSESTKASSFSFVADDAWQQDNHTY